MAETLSTPAAGFRRGQGGVPRHAGAQPPRQVRGVQPQTQTALPISVSQKL